MLLKHVKSYIIGELRVRVVLLLLLVTSLIMVWFYYQKSLRTQVELKEQFRVLQGNVTSMQKDIDQSRENLKAWNDNIKEIIGDKTGLRIKDAKKIIERLKHSKLISNISISLSNPELRINFKKPKYTNLSYSNVSISFYNLTDVGGLKFIYGILHDLPGYIQVRELKMSVDKEIEGLLNSNVATLKMDNLVRFKLEFLWQDYEDLEIAKKTTEKTQRENVGKK